MRVILSMVFCVAALASLAQPHGRRLPAIVEGEDTIAYVYLKSVEIEAQALTPSEKREVRYSRLAYDVKKVMPYVDTCAAIIKEVDSVMATIEDEDEKEAYLKTREDELRERFEGPLRRLSKEQGRILVKLIDRQLGKPTYELIKQYKSSWSAFYWHGFAVMFGSDLKERYDPKENRDLELTLHILGYE